MLRLFPANNFADAEPEVRAPSSLHVFERYGLALAGVGVVFVLARQFWPAFASDPVLLFLPVVAAAAWFSGFGPGLLAALTSGMGVHVLAHNLRFAPPGWDDLLTFATFVLTATLVAYLIARQRRTEVGLEAIKHDLSTAGAELTTQRLEMARFQDFSLRISSGLELRPLLAEVLTTIARLRKTDRALLLLNNGDGRLAPIAWHGFSEEQIRRFWRWAASEPGGFSGPVPVVVHDTEAQSFSSALLQAARVVEVRAMHSVPLAAPSGTMVGAVMLFFPEPCRPTDKEVRLLELYARQGANAIENAQRYGQSVKTMLAEQRRALLLDALAAASVRINAALNLDSLLQTIADEARATIGAHQSFACLAPGGDWSRMMNCVSLSEKYAAAMQDFARGAPEMLFLAGRLQRGARSGKQADLLGWNVISQASGQQSWLAAPLTSREGNTIGLIQLVEKMEGEFTEEDQAVLTQLAQIALVAIENVRLYRQAEEQIREFGRAQEALERSMEALDLTHQAAGIGVWEWNLQTGELTWSKEISALHGFASESFDGRYATWLESVHPEDRDQVNSAVTRAISEGTGYQVQYRNLRPDDNIRWMEARGQVYYTGGRPLRMLGVAMDITVRRLAEEALRASEKLAATGRLAASIAHEINNPLASVTNILYLLGRNRSLDNDARKFVALAESELTRVTHITRQTLAFYRESTRPAPVSLSQILDEVLALYARNVSEREVTVERNYEFTDVIYGFAGELRQVVSNLLLNAIEAVPKGGDLRIHLYRTRDLIREEGEGVNVVIADNGSGITPELRHRIFEPFFSTKGEKGTGLGLWVSLGIVEKHGGRIRVRSSVDPEHCGTVFSVFLPMDHFAGQGQGEEMQAVA